MPKKILQSVHPRLHGLRKVLARDIRPRFFGLRYLTWAVVILLVTIPLLIASPEARGDGRLPPSTSIAGIDISRMKPDDAFRVVSPAVIDAGNSIFVINILGEPYEFTAADIGIVYDLDTTINNIMATGERGNYPLIATIEPVQFQRHLEQINGTIPSPAIDAQVRIEGTTAVVTPGEVGQTFQLETYRHKLFADEPQPVIDLELSLSEPNISTQEADAAAVRANALMAEPIQLVAEGETWEIQAADFAPAIIIAPDGKGDLGIHWDMDILMPHLDSVANEINARQQSDAWIQDLGTHSWLVPETSGLSVDRKELIKVTNSTLIAGEHIINVPVALLPPEKTSDDVMKELGITGVIATGDSIYTGSGIGRAHNVETAAYYINRTLVPPGGSYSFNDSVGSLFTGEYMSAGSYIDGPNGESIAGGVCQVSTTVFRAALNAGFPIEERWPHSYRSTFYELGDWSPGFDAAIVQDSVIPQDSTDLRFSNPTDSWLMITAETNGDRLEVQIWGEETGYKVTYSEPDIWVAYPAPQSLTVMVDDQLPVGTLERQAPLEGLGVWFTRTVTTAEGKPVLEDTWETIYYATGPIVRVSPDMEEKAYSITD